MSRTTARTTRSNESSAQASSDQDSEGRRTRSKRAPSKLATRGRALMRLRPTAQAKLTVNQPGDKYEQEADRVAGQVMRMPEPQVQRQVEGEEEEEELLQTKRLPNAITPLVQRQIEGEEEEEELLQTKRLPNAIMPLVQRQVEDEEEELLQTKRASTNDGPSAAPPSVHDALRSPGQPLDADTRAFMEPRFGHDFDDVRVHTDAQAADSAQAVDAQAYTVGRDVVFGAGQHAPETVEGKRLLAHELTHVVQQAVSRDTDQQLVHRQIEAANDEALVRAWMAQGITNENILTNELYIHRHPSDRGAKLKPGTPMATEWVGIRNRIVRPLLDVSTGTAKKPVSSLYEDILRPLGKKLKKMMETLDTGVKDLFGLLTSEEQPPAKIKVENEVTNTLAKAIELEKELKRKHPDYAKKGGFLGYGEGAADLYVCTTFTEAVLKKAGYKISGTVSKGINISIDFKAETGKNKPSKKETLDALAKLVKNDDPRIKGVVSALVNSGQGIEVTVNQLQPGDFVQYWYEGKEGIAGHVVQVVKVIKPGKKIKAHGSHRFTRGVKTITVFLSGKKMKKVYAVRPT